MQVARTWFAICLHKHSYRVTVRAGYDHAFILCLVIILQVYSYRHSYSQAGQQQAASMTDTSGSGQNDQLHLSKTPHNLNAVAVAATKP